MGAPFELARFVEWLVASTLLLAALHGVQRILRRRASAAARERLWRLGWVALALLPVAELGLPPLALWHAPPGDARASEVHRPATTPLPQLAERATAAAVPAEPIATAEAGPADPLGARAASPWRLVDVLALLWLLGIVLANVPAFAAAWRVRRLVRRLPPWSDRAWVEDVERIRASFRGLGPIELRATDAVRSPSVWCGWFGHRTVLFVPFGSLAVAPSARLSILRHELAHAVRRDLRAQRAARLVATTLWFHPLAWLALRAQRRDAESASDDLALSLGATPSLYAEHLLEALARAGSPDARALHGIPMTREENVLMHRVRVILDPTIRRAPPRPGRVRAAGALLWTATTLLAAASGVPAVADDAAPPPTAAAQRALERGLAHLAATQDPETGGWIGDVGYKLNLGYHVTGAGRPHLGVSALCVRAFVRAGHTPWSEGPHQAVVARGMAFLMGHADLSTGYLHAHGTRMKSHALALACLADLMRLRPEQEPEKGLVERLLGDPSPASLRDVVATAAAFGITTQNEQGGWRYHPYSQDADLLVTTLMIEALVAARRAGIEVQESVLERARQLVLSQRAAADPPAVPGRAIGAFRYQAAPGSRSSATNDAAGVTVLAQDPRRERELRVTLRETLAQAESLPADHATHYVRWFACYLLGEAARLTPRASLAASLWDAYRPTEVERIVAAQRADGSWPNDVGPGPAFASAVACLWLVEG